MSFIFLRNRVTGGAAFSPASLFASGEEGAWYEPSTTTAFRSKIDLTPCGYGQSAGFLLDLSKGAGYSGGSFTGLGSELVTNGTFDTDTDWTKGSGVTISGGVANAVSATTIVSQPVPMVSGSTYLITLDYTMSSGQRLNIVNNSVGNITNLLGSSGTVSIVLVAGSTGLTISASGAVFTGTLDNISVRELPGNHAVQNTEAARPLLARIPATGRRNLLTGTDDLATQSVTVTAAQRTLSFTGTGTVTLTGASTAGPLVGTGAGDRVSLTFTPSAGSLTLTVLGAVTDAQLELGASATTYQSVADSLGYDITEAGVTSLEYLAFDGSDDFMSAAPTSTSSVTMFLAADGGEISMADEASSIVYVRSVLTPTDHIANARNSANLILNEPRVGGAELMTAIYDTFGSGNFYLRANGVQTDTASLTVNPVAFLDNLVIGSLQRSGTDAYTAGNFYGGIVVDVAVSGENLTNTETYMEGLLP